MWHLQYLNVYDFCVCVHLLPWWWCLSDFQSQLDGGRLHPGHWPAARQMGISEGDAAADRGEPSDCVCVCEREKKNRMCMWLNVYIVIENLIIYI